VSPELTGECMEFRFPLLDTRVIEYVFSVPPIPWCQHKRLAREAFRAHLPGAVVDRPKTGLTGFNDALVADWRRRTFPSNGDSLIADAGISEWIDVTKWTAALRTGSTDDVMAAWRVIELGSWLASVESRRYREAVDV
jgi:asparagine synthase (glutamine-hydrolysing)